MKPKWVLRTAEDRQRFVSALMALPLTKPLAVTCKLFRKRRTLAQNREYWWQINAMVEWLAMDTGNDAGDLHLYLKRRFCPRKLRRILDIEIMDQSTTALDTVEMSVYRERCLAWAAEEFGYVADDPIPHNVREEIPE